MNEDNTDKSKDKDHHIDYTNKLNRMVTPEIIARLKKANKQFDIDDDVYALLKELDEMYYEDIRNNLILDSEDLYDLLEMFNDYKDTKKVHYLSYLINNYYPGFFQEKIDKAIAVDDYELAAFIKPLLNSIERPTTIE
ncbi:hypothetical protein ACFLQ5_01960 [Bacteroidota bacterium]